MIKTLSFLALAVSTSSFAAALKATLVWEVTTGMAQPESMLYDADTDTIFVSNVSGEPTKKDKLGWISTLSSDGKAKNEKWYTDLNAPKGMAIHNGVLWVTDIDRVISIRMKDQKLLKAFDVKGAMFLNDIAAAKDETIYVSDTAANRIHVLKGDKLETFLEGADLEAPNGLFVNPPYLVVAGWGKGVDANLGTKGPGSLYNVDLKTKKRSPILDPIGNLDGLELAWAPLNGYFVSDWVKGVVYHTGKSRKPSSVVLEGLKGSADIGTIPAKKLLLVPEMAASRVRAYRIE